MLKAAPELEEDDILVTSSSVTGEDLKFSPKARERYPFAVECKNQEKLAIWAALEQAQTHVKGNNRIPTLIFKRNKTKLFIAMGLEEFLRIYEPRRS